MESGTVLDGRYRLERRLGQGGMGEVWSAHDLRLERQVALKLVLARLAAPAELLARLTREARTAASLQHSGITVVHDVSEHAGTPFFVMELLAGTDLATLIRDRHPGGMPVGRTVEMALAVSEALAHAHDRGVVHRDIKPENIMVLPDGTTKICDFGIARFADATTLTAEGRPLGTPSFMAPEQWRAEQARPGTDLYSLGCTLHAMLTGRPPFSGNQHALMYQHLNAPAPELDPERHGFPPDLCRLVGELLRKEIGNRPKSAAAVARRLRAMRHPAPPAPRRPPAPPLPEPDGRAGSAHPDSGTAAGRPGPRRPVKPPDPTVPGPVREPTVRPPKPFPRRRALLVAGGTVAATALGVPAVWGIVSEALRGDPPEVPHPAPAPGVIVSGAHLWCHALSPDGRTLAAGWENDLQLWDVATSRLVRTIPTGHPDDVVDAAFHPKRPLLATAGGSGDRAAKLWDLTTGRLLRTFSGHKRSAGLLAFSPDGGTLATTGYDDPPRTWDVESGRLLATCGTGGRDRILFSPRDGSLISFTELSSLLTAHDPRNGRLLWEDSIKSPGGDTITSIALSPDRSTLVVGEGTGITFRDPRTGEVVRSGRLDFYGRHLTYSPNGRLLAGWSIDRVIRLLDATSLKVVKTFTGHTEDAAHLLAFTPDGRHLVSATSDNSARLWKI
ncbi:hypothetical protein DPM19_22895 [Actinomadura craniellae]|uniref:non-specific serine/threonine protein kinase n=1 Tax=Actinomadura craniellae TaxID=2231787 RepID=A0A365H1A9_9ACTN|nr:serine/threonine-protein kinase [Actinomadura craniellae]RAY12867.1 hypothetical protein DPM19_22895 [Actinomadura craniellae]